MAESLEQKIAVVIPMFNEEEVIEETAARLYETFKDEDNIDIILVDNNSTDSTVELAPKLCEEYGFKYNCVKEQGKGAAVMQTWLDRKYDGYDVYAFWDVYLSTDLDYFDSLINAVGDGIAIGARHLNDSIVDRSPSRRFVSWGYRSVANLVFGTDYDFQCGFKAISAEVRDNVVSDVRDNGFFFDTELIIKAREKKYPVTSVPVKWDEKPGSTVKWYKAVPQFLTGLGKLMYHHYLRK